ncbi:Resolvase, N terminal domain family [Candidatus Terasakiella magnetica]|uniref:Resolvase, N terminal domain family n=1 Tax=Candidatus Terasakiella magnetica TaxID=1867952 RepID=A0A1C3RF39_9PROT|nr:recombinase family protein [Candidatus Terasakiella magnetica]SCA55897.1 Resolvase, N terminal domain family [Candidatus Terasakiella magnetica]
MKRAVIYARYSSDKQNANSCADQIRLCTQWANKNNISIVDSYYDEAMSGSTTHNRTGLNTLLYDAKSKDFDIVLCEHLDRLSRDQGDLADIRKKLNFEGIDLYTVSNGEVSTIEIGVNGLLGEMYLKNLSEKTHRGMEAALQAGRIPCGKSYGYTPTEGQKGCFTIDTNEADIIRRIFSEYIDGATPHQIALGLNNDNIPSPRGQKWNKSTIAGSKSRLSGILRNRLYNGVFVWNRQQFKNNPYTGNRNSDLNDKSEWQNYDFPQYEIIDDITFNKVTEILSERSTNTSPVSKRKAKHLLSGLTKCGCCGASYTVQGSDRLRCAGLSERGDCDNTRTIKRVEVEDRVLTALQSQLTSPELISTYIKIYHEERKRLKSLERSEADNKRARLIELEKEIHNILKMIDAGVASLEIANRLTNKEQERETLNAELALIEEDDVVQMHPGTADHYGKLVANLQDTLSQYEEGLARDAVFAEVRSLIEKIVITPEQIGKKGSPVTIEVHGVLASLLSVSNNSPSCWGKVVAGARFELTTFRL